MSVLDIHLQRPMRMCCPEHARVKQIDGQAKQLLQVTRSDCFLEDLKR